MIEYKVSIQNVDQIQKLLAEKPKETEREVGKAIKKAVYKVNEKAKRKSPVDTGLLRTSMTAEPRGMEGEIYAGVHYAIYVHEGTRFMRKRPFLANAVKESERDIERYLEEAIINVIK